MTLVFGFLLVCLAEAVAIYAASAATDPTRKLFPLLLWMVFSGFLLMIGYRELYKDTKNIWVVSVLTTLSILLVEPAVVWFLFKELPSKGAVIGFVLGVLGFVATVSIK